MENWHDSTIAELQAAMQSGAITSETLAAHFLTRIVQLDRAGPRLNSVIEVNPEALAQAAARDAERRRGEAHGPLHGLPILLKDNIDTADRLQTTAGSLALAAHYAAQDAFLVRRLRAAGVVILGKANLSEWANFRSTHSSSGWSSRGGQVRNPYALDRNPCGSSSGSAVAVAAGLCAAAIGTETDGSIVCPSQANSVVGIKPTLGLISRRGVIPIAHSQDTAGPMARCVADAAALLGAMVGVDPQDIATHASAGRAFVDYRRFLDTGALHGARLGVARQFFGFSPAVDRVMETCLEALAAQDAVLVDPVELTSEEKLSDSEVTVLLYEFKHDLNAYLASAGPQVAVHSLAEVIAFNEAQAAEVMPYFGQERMLSAQEKGALDKPEYLEALATNHRLAREEGIDAVLSEQKLDAILAPTGGPAWLTDWVTGDHYGGGCSSLPAVAGYPHITVPAGYVHGLPVGLSFFGGAYQEPRLLGLAYAFEQASRVRRPPAFKPGVEFV